MLWPMHFLDANFLALITLRIFIMMTLIFLLSIKSVSKEDTKIFLFKMAFFLKENVFVFLNAPLDYLLLEKHMRED